MTLCITERRFVKWQVIIVSAIKRFETENLLWYQLLNLNLLLQAAFVSDLFSAQRSSLTVVTETDGDPPSQSGNSGTNRIC
jgi:hypothetical protein